MVCAILQVPATLQHPITGARRPGSSMLPPRWVPQTWGCCVPQHQTRYRPGTGSSASSWLWGGGPCLHAQAVGESVAGWINCWFCSQVSVLDPSPGAAMKTEPGLGE